MKLCASLAHLLIAAVMIGSSMRTESILWARGARHFGGECPADKGTCTLALVPSPDGRKAAKVSLNNFNPSFEIIEGSAHHLLNALSKDPELPFVQMEILWSPDSSAVSFAWNISAISETSRIYQVAPDGPKLLNLLPVMYEFAKDYPPCIEVSGPCNYSLAGEDSNYLTVAWSGSHDIVLMAEASESSGYGKNFAQVEGFEIDASTGKILRKMQAREFKQRWQTRMGWKFRIPEPPPTT